MGINYPWPYGEYISAEIADFFTKFNDFILVIDNNDKFVNDKEIPLKSCPIIIGLLFLFNDSWVNLESQLFYNEDSIESHS